MKYEILQGDNRDTLKTIADNSIDAIVTDPPYGIDFLGKSWDADTGALETYQECLRVLKPGGHIVAFSAARTYHHLAITLEQAGFEIRDQIMWIYSSGFPKSQDIGKSIQRSLGVKETIAVKGGARPSDKQTGGRAKGKVEAKQEYTTPVLTDPSAQQWSGWGTQLKPAHEPIALARKPMKLSIARNCLVHGVGALNIDATRVPYDGSPLGNPNTAQGIRQQKGEFGNGMMPSQPAEWHEQGRFPSNVLGEIPDYQKYFYCPKVSRKERHIGHPLPEAEPLNLPGNNHPTVKPIELMKYLIKLVTPPGGTVLDPFSGSGSTGCAAVELGHTYIGCELDPRYVEISLKRIAEWIRPENNFDDLFDFSTHEPVKSSTYHR